MKVPDNQLTLNFPKVERNFGKVSFPERTRDSDGRFASDMAIAGNETDRLKYENEMLQRKYMAVAKQLANTERELLKYKRL
jgi:hypothetical protein